MKTEALKSSLVQWLLQLQDEKTLNKIQRLKDLAEIKAYEDDLKPMSLEEFNARDEEATQDIEAGNVHSLEEVMNENWD